LVCQPYVARRVPGLRREEVAVLAGVSVPYYTRLERGDMSGVSDIFLGWSFGTRIARWDARVGGKWQT
jgi:transcriptional regulator with XRE-family HTH domain